MGEHFGASGRSSCSWAFSRFRTVSSRPNAYQGYFGPHSSPGTFAVSGVVLLGVLVKRDKFDFNTLCRIALPLTVVALFLISVLGFTDDYVSGFCVAGGYTAFSILIMVLCSNLCYRYEVSAIWLFGMERSLRLYSCSWGAACTNTGRSSPSAQCGGQPSQAASPFWPW